MKLLLIIFTLLFVCCKNVDKVDFNNPEKYNKIDINNYNISFSVDSICDNTEKYSGYVYFLDTECSICLSTFLDFIFNTIKLNKSHYPISLIVDSGNKPIMEYYISQLRERDRIKISVYENINNRFLKKELASYSDIVLFYENNILKNSFIYQK